MIGNTVLDLKEAGIGLQVGTLHHIAQDAIELVVAGGDDHIAITGGEGIIRISRLIAVADSLRDTAGGLIDHGDVLHGSGHGVHQSHIHLFARPVFCLFTRAASTPTVMFKAPSTSPMGVPERVAGLLGQPLVLIRPPMA